MHAVRIHQFGDETVLRYEEVPDPRPGPGEVRVAVKAASINHGDLARRNGTYPGEMGFPLTLGWEVAGEIDALGDGIDRKRLGQRVVAIATSGGYAERMTTPGFAAVPLPDGLDFDAAASIPVVFLTAWYGLITTADVQRGQWVLVHAGASGVGMAGIQIAKQRGARVLATASTAEKLEFARRLGADATINYVDSDFVEEAHGAFAPRGCCREGTEPWPLEGIGMESRTLESDAPMPTGEPGKGATAGHVPSANPDGAAPVDARAPPASTAYVRPRHFPWADLLRRTFEIDILACPDCGNRLRLVATIENRTVIEKILAHLGLPLDVPTPAPARSTEWLPGILSGPEAGADSEWFD